MDYRRVTGALLLPMVAMYATFQGIQQILIPASMDALDPANKIGNLSMLITASSIAAVVALPLGGALSDRTRGRWGRRTPWLVIMSVLSGLLMLLLRDARALMPIVAICILLWFTLNFYQGALTAVLPDRIPREHRGGVSAVLGLGVPFGIILGVNLAARTEQDISYVYFAVAVVLSTALFAWLAPEGAYPPPGHQRSTGEAETAAPPTQSPLVAPGSFFSSFRSRDFTFAFVSRALLFLAYFGISGYWFYALQDHIGVAELPEHSAKLAVSIMNTWSMVAWVLTIPVAGWLADRLRRHKMFIGIAAVGVAGGMAVPVLLPSWPGMLIFAVSNGVFFGSYMAIDLALMSFVLPNRATEGRDMGILAVATAGPQILAPVIGGSMITHLGYGALFVFGALTALMAAIAAFFIKGVR